MNWFFIAMKKSFTLSGRARRAEFGWFSLIYLLTAIALALLELFAQLLQSFTTAEILSVILFIFPIITFPAQISLAVRRLHDLGYSGKWQLVIIILSTLFSIIDDKIEQAYETNNYFLMFSSITYVLAMISWTGWLIFKDGQPHANKYGESPKYPSETDLVV